MIGRKITYYIPHPTFFSKHPYGRVTHAIGILNGFIKNGFDVTVIAEKGILNFKERIHPDVKFKTLKGNGYWSHLRICLNVNEYIAEGTIFLYRKTLFSFIWRILFSLLSKRNRNLTIAEVNGFIFDYDPRFAMKFLPAISLIIHKILLRQDQLIYVVNEDLKDQLVTGKFSLDETKVISIHNGGPDPSPIQFKDGDLLQLVYFGILAAYNDWETLFTSVKGKSNLCLHIVGNGPELDRLKILAGEDSNIFFYGSMPFDKFKGFVESLTGKVTGILPHKIPNRLGSLSPIKAFDYMSLGMPLIYSHICLKGQVEDGVEGYEYKVGETFSLNRAIDRAAITSNYLEIKTNCISNYPKHTWEARMMHLITEIDKCVE